MSGEWHEVALGDLVEIFDGPHATPAKTEEGPVFLGISNLTRGRLELSDVEHLSDDDYCRWTRRIEPRAGDVVFSYETRLGEAAPIPDGLRCCLGRRMGLLRARAGKIDERFLLYAYLGPQFQETLRARTVHGSTVDRIPLIEMPAFPISIPKDVGEQLAIAHILGTLDDKIELNRRTSETLEAMARALFKSWFVNFDPVRAKAEGRDAGLSDSIANVFPSSFEDSELGEIPKGWSATHWGSKVTLEYGRSLAGYAEGNGPYPVYGTNGQIGTHVAPLCQHEGIIIGRKGAYRGVHYCNSPFYVIDTAFYVEPSIPMEMRWGYYELLRTDINNLDSGSAIPSTSREDFYSIPVVWPSLEVQRAFVRQMSPVWQRQEVARRESQTLAVLRDALLPKLMSGELHVSSAERILEDAVA